MADKTKTPKPVPGFPMPGQVASHLPDILLTVAKMQASLYDAWMRQNIEMADFLKARFERDRSLAAKIAEIEDPAEAMEVWSKFWQQTVEDYANEPHRIANLMASAAAEVVKEARDEAAALADKTRATPV